MLVHVFSGKMNRGLSVIDTYSVLLGRPLNDTELFRASVLGWAVEWVCILLFLVHYTTDTLFVVCSYKHSSL